ncbi:MAG TPA: phosphate signaling complex protein PhoU [Rectinemataceae bacterium]|nr:phosphate signaling complex protein PhoU [Rectinemataceae bacterium]
MPERTQFTGELNQLDHDILVMGARVEEAIGKALQALRARDLELARAVKTEDEEIDDLQNAIDDQVAVIIATQQPVAKDLRELVSVFKVTDNLERAADYAVHLAKAVKKFATEPQFHQIERLERMAELGASMVRGAVNAYLRRDVEEARRVAAIDDLIDEQHKLLQREVIDFMRERPEQAERAAKLLTTSGFLERLGDHMTTICEAAVFVVESRHVDLNG